MNNCNFLLPFELLNLTVDGKVMQSHLAPFATLAGLKRTPSIPGKIPTPIWLHNHKLNTFLSLFVWGFSSR